MSSSTLRKHVDYRSLGMRCAQGIKTQWGLNDSQVEKVMAKIDPKLVSLGEGGFDLRMLVDFIEKEIRERYQKE